MKFERIVDDELNGAVNGIDGTILRVIESTALDDEHFDDLEYIFRQKEEGTSGQSDNLIKTGSIRNGLLRHAEIDITTLWKLVYEHRRYAAAKGFSDAEMNVLRAIEFHSATRVGIDEIMDDYHTADVSESMVYKSLKNLQDKKLITKVRPGVYQYIGP